MDLLRSRPLVAAVVVLWLLSACSVPQAVPTRSSENATTNATEEADVAAQQPGATPSQEPAPTKKPLAPRNENPKPEPTPTPAPQPAPKPKAAAQSSPKTAVAAQPREQESGAHPFVLAYYTEDEPSDGLEGSFDVMLAQASRIDALVPFWFQLAASSDGSIVRFGGVTQKTIKNVVKTAHDNNIEVYALIHNLLYSGETTGQRVAQAVLNNPSRRKKLVAQTVGVLEGYGFDGVNIDFESIGPAVEDGYITYLQELSAELKPRGLKLTVSVPPKTTADDESNWSGGYDYKSIGKYADLVAIMTYQDHGPGTPPGPISPIDWVQRVMEYASSVIPRDRLLVGVGGYGFDWTDDGSGHTQYLGYQQAHDRLAIKGSKENYDTEHQAPSIVYSDTHGVRHEVWYDDARSTRAKLQLTKQSGYAGIALWRLGMEDPAIWNDIGRRE